MSGQSDEQPLGIPYLTLIAERGYEPTKRESKSMARELLALRERVAKLERVRVAAEAGFFEHVDEFPGVLRGFRYNQDEIEELRSALKEAADAGGCAHSGSDGACETCRRIRDAMIGSKK